MNYTYILLIVFLVLGCTDSGSEEIKDCGYNETCILGAMKTCEPAKYNVLDEDGRFSLLIKTLSKEEEGICRYSVNITTAKENHAVVCVYKNENSRGMGNDICSNNKTLDEILSEKIRQDRRIKQNTKNTIKGEMLSYDNITVNENTSIRIMPVSGYFCCA